MCKNKKTTRTTYTKQWTADSLHVALEDPSRVLVWEDGPGVGPVDAADPTHIAQSALSSGCIH